MTDITPEALEALSKKATPGTWEVDSEYDNDALYSGGGGCGSGFKNYFIGADVGGTWKTLLDTVNSDHKLIEEDYDEGGKEAWDVIGRANAAFIVALVNAYRTGQLVPAQPSGDVVEAVALAIMVTNGACFVKDWTTERRDNPHVALAWDQATAAITAYEAASGVAKMRLECLEMSEKLQDAEEEVAALTKAMHDAINAPKGVVPASAEAFYNPAGN